MDLKQIIEEKRAAEREARRQAAEQATQQAKSEELFRQHKAVLRQEEDRMSLQRQSESEENPPKPISFSDLVAKKRKRPDSDNQSTELFVDTNTPQPPRSPKKAKTPRTTNGFASPTEHNEESTTPRSAFAPPKKGPRKKAVYTNIEVVDTRRKPSEWYTKVDMNQKYSRGDLQTVSYVRTLIKNCVDAYKNGGDTERHFSELRKKVHEMEFYPFLNGAMAKKSKVLESEGLSQTFDGPDKGIFPWDIAADAEALWLRWMGGDMDFHLLRGITTSKGVLTNGKKRTSHKLDHAYTQRRSANVVGTNDLLNGQWWPSRICALRDGAHGEQEAGIHGQTGKGAYSVVVAEGGYADEDHGSSVEYCGTASETSTPTRGTAFLQDAYIQKQPLRVLRAKNPKSKYAPKEGIRYDGLYEITDKEILDPKTAMFRFSLRRINGQDPIRYKGVEVRPTDQELKEIMKIREYLA